MAWVIIIIIIIIIIFPVSLHGKKVNKKTPLSFHQRFLFWPT